MRLIDRFSAHLDTLRLRPGPVLVAVSGGVDSVVLLDLVRRVAGRHGLEPVVAHVDHGIHPESGRVAERVERLAAEFGLVALVGRLALGPAVTETRARVARLRWLEATRRGLGAGHILLAHQADDQAETVLMRLLRGSGPAGLAGIPARRGRMVRPLLPYTRSTLLRYARARGLSWWEDPANRDTRHLRSWLRQEILPQLAERLPDVAGRLRHAGRQAAAARRAWSAALRNWPGLAYRREAGAVSADWTVLFSLPGAVRGALAQALVRLAGAPTGPARVRAALRALATGQSGATADLGSGWAFELAFDRLRVLPPREPVAGQIVPIASLRGEASWGGFRVRWAPEAAPRTQVRDGRTAWFIPGVLLLRPWRAGDRLAPLGGRGHRLAVRCFQDARIPSSERRRWPILEGEGELAWIPGVCRSNRMVPRPGDPAVRVDVEFRG
jgi:tRNA(Ile)-lysidine synthase